MPSIEAASAEHRLMVLMFTDLLNSSGLKMQVGDLVYARAVAAPHNRIFREQIARFPGAEELNYSGDGFLANFRSVSDAVEAALLFHQALREFAWEAVPVQTRIGIHVGEVVVLDSGDPKTTCVTSHAADMCARLMSLGGGGQTLLTRNAFDDARQYVRAHPQRAGEEPPALGWAAHGRYRFKGRDDDPMEVFEVGAIGHAPLTAPASGEKARRVLDADEEQTLGWRPAAESEIPGRPGWYTVDKIGEGGFGEVWLVRQPKTGAERVFKFCFEPDRLRSLKRELTIFRLIREALGDREDIVRLHDVRLDRMPFYLESDYVRHGSLVRWATARGGFETLPLGLRLEIMRGICDAVSAAHSLGIIHKDLKPSNVLMREDKTGRAWPVLADFGIGAITDHSQFEKLGVTQTGFTMSMAEARHSGSSGTRMYAPPESMLGKAATIQSDVFALGVLLYQFATGDLHRPLATGWEHDVPDEILRDDIAAATAGRVDERLHSVQELIARLESQPARRRRLRQRRAAKRVAVAFAGLAVLAALCVLGWQSTQRGKIHELNARIQQQLEAPAWSPDNLAATDALVEALAKASPADAAAQRPRVQARLARYLGEAIRRPNLAEADRAAIESGLALLQTREPGAAASLRRTLAARLRQWEPVYSLQAPFEKNLPEGAKVERDGVTFAQRSVLLPPTLRGNTRIEATVRDLAGFKSPLGFEFQYEGKRNYGFRLLPGKLVMPPPLVLEAGTESFCVNMEGWYYHAPGATSRVKEAGSLVWKVERRAGDLDDVFWQKEFDAAPHRGKVWEVSFRGRVPAFSDGAQDAKAGVNLFARLPDGKTVGQGVWFAKTADWTSRSFKLAIPRDADFVTLKVQVMRATGKLELTDLRVIETDAAAPEAATGPSVPIRLAGESEWMPVTNPAHRWMLQCDASRARVMKEDGVSFVRLANASGSGRAQIAGRVPFEPGTVGFVKVHVRGRQPGPITPNPGRNDVPRISVRFLNQTLAEMQNTGMVRDFGGRKEWSAIDFKVPVPFSATTLETRISDENVKGAIDVAEFTCTFEPAAGLAEAENGGQSMAVIARDGTTLRQAAVPASWLEENPLRVAAERMGSFLRWQIGEHPVIEVFDPLPIPAREHRAVLWQGSESSVRALTAFRQTLPADPQPLEIGDQSFAVGKISEALAAYEKELAAGNNAASRGEALFKCGLCLQQLKRGSEGEARLAEAARSDAEPWSVLAACQLLATFVAEQRMEDADATLQFLKARRDFAQIAGAVPDQVRENIAKGYIQHYRSTFEFGSEKEWSTAIGRLSDLLAEAEPLRLTPATQLSLAWNVNRFLEATGQKQRALDEARKWLSDVFDDPDRFAEEAMTSLMCQSFRRLHAQAGHPDGAMDLVQRLDSQRPGRAFGVEVVRCLVAMDRMEGAESRVRELTGGHGPVANGTLDHVFVVAKALHGAVLEKRGRPEEARAIWKGAMNEIQRAFDTASTPSFFGSGGRGELFQFGMLAALSGEMRDKDATLIRDRTKKTYLDMVGADNPAGLAFIESATNLLDRNALAAMWTSERGGLVARKMILGETPYPDYYALPMLVIAEEVLIQGTVGRQNLTAEQETGFFRATEDLLDSARQGHLDAVAMLSLATTWKGAANLFGPTQATARLAPKTRSAMSYVLGQRMLRLGRKDEARKLFEEAIATAPDGPYVALAKEAVGAGSPEPQ